MNILKWPLKKKESPKEENQCRNCHRIPDSGVAMMFTGFNQEKLKEWIDGMNLPDIAVEYNGEWECMILSNPSRKIMFNIHKNQMVVFSTREGFTILHADRFNREYEWTEQEPHDRYRSGNSDAESRSRGIANADIELPKSLERMRSGGGRINDDERSCA